MISNEKTLEKPKEEFDREVTKGQQWVAELTTSKKFKIKSPLCYENISEFCPSCIITSKNDRCSIFFEVIDDQFINKRIQKELVLSELSYIADLLSWEFNIPLKEEYTYYRRKKINIPDTKTLDVKLFYEEIFGNKINEEKKEILSAFRQIKNENNKAPKNR